MVSVICIALSFFVPQAAKSAALPDTPQGRRVGAWIAAFNSGDEKVFLAAQREHFVPALLEKRPEAEQIKMYQRMRGDFGTLAVERVAKATAEEIQIVVPTQDGAEGTFTFEFDTKAPHRIRGLGIDVKDR